MNNLTDINVIKALLKKHGFTFSKALGQNFLINPSVAPEIAECGNAKPGFGILEIGAGIGVLTKELALRAEKVAAVEVDGRLIPVLKETLAWYSNVTVINEDVMRINLHDVIKEHFTGMDVAVCANLPYYITSPVIMMLLESRLELKSITVMVQKEAGIRLCAKPGTREAGAVTFAVRYYSEPELLFNVSRESFMPSPNVDSCVIKLNIRDSSNWNVSDEKLYFKTVRGAFSQRRKTLANSLSSSLGIEKQKVISVLKTLAFTESVRPEQLSMDDFIKISDSLYS